MKLKHLNEIKRLVDKRRDVEERLAILGSVSSISCTVYSQTGRAGLSLNKDDNARAVEMIAGPLRCILERDRRKILDRLAELGVTL